MGRRRCVETTGADTPVCQGNLASDGTLFIGRTTFDVFLFLFSVPAQARGVYVYRFKE
jgi:hypothetical protein